MIAITPTWLGKEKFLTIFSLTGYLWYRMTGVAPTWLCQEDFLAIFYHVSPQGRGGSYLAWSGIAPDHLLSAKLSVVWDDR